MKRASPPSEPSLPSTWANAGFGALPKYNKTQHAVTFGFTPEVPYTVGAMEHSDRTMVHPQENGFASETSKEMNRYGSLTQQHNQVLPRHNGLEIPSRNLVIHNNIQRNDAQVTQRNHNEKSECYSSAAHHESYDANQTEMIGISQIAELRNNFASRSAMSEPCSPTKTHRKASTSSDTKPRGGIIKRSWKPPTPPSSQNSEEAWQIPTFQVPSQAQKIATDKKSRSGSYIPHIDTSHQHSHAIESPLSSAPPAQQKNFIKSLRKHQPSSQLQQDNGWYNTFPMPQADTPMPTLIGGVALPLRRSSSQAYQVNLPGPFSFLGRDLESAPQYQQQVIGQQNLPEQQATAFSGSCDVPMQEANCFTTPWIESHQWPTWQETPATYQ